MSLKISIKKRALPKWLIWLLILMPFMLATMNEVLGLPYAVRYIMDAAWLVLTVLMLLMRSRQKKQQVGDLMIWVLLFFLCTLLVYIVQYQSIWYYLWGFRNNFRFYAAFFAFSLFLSAEDIEYYVGIFDKLFWIDVVVCVYQYFALNVHQDYMGGLFGSQGGNSFTNIYFLIVLSMSMVRYLERKEKMGSCIAKSAAALAVAAMSELKFFYIEFVLLIILSSLFTHFTWRKLWTILGGIAAVIAGAGLLTIIFPAWGDWFSLNWFWETATSDVGYTGSGDLNRLTAIPKINELWLTHWSQRIFGMGLGNCDTASYAIVNTSFFEQYGHMHYTWLSYAVMYLECGWVGLIFSFGFFVLVFWEIQRISRRSDSDAKTYCRISSIMAILCAIIAIYNSSLRAEGAYMVYFVLAIPFVFAREESFIH